MINIVEYLKDLINRSDAGQDHYELAAHETKSGQVKEIRFYRKFDYDEEADEVTNDRIIF